MFCPRCGRPVNPSANFCGGCGLPKAEIEKSVIPQVQPAPEVNPVDVNELNKTLNQLEGDLTGINPVENYTTDTDINTNADTNETENIVEEIRLSVENTADEKTAVEENAYSGQSDYSRNAPQHPFYTSSSYTQPAPAAQPVQPADQNLSTVDYIWMMLISSLPLIGMFYLIYQGFVQQDNINKRGWARAMLILYVFAFVMGLVFTMGIVMTQFMYW